MKVLIISDAWHPQVNGVVRTYEYLCKEITEAGHITEVIGPAHFAASIPMPFYPEIKLVIRPYRRLRRLIRDFNPDRIHIATEGPLGWAARKYCIKHNVSFSTSYHTQFPDYVAKRFAWLIPPLYNAVHKRAVKVVRYFHKPSSTIMVSTKSLETQLKEWGFTTPIKPLTRGIDSTIFYPGEKNIMQYLKKPIALYVGRVAIEKNLEAFLDMKWSGSKVIVGDGPARASLHKQYPNAIFVGKKKGQELADYYRSSDVFTFPSKTDTFGIVLIESLACGLPIAAYNVMGPKDIVIDTAYGALSETLEEACEKAMRTADPEKCAAYAKENFSWKIAGQQFMNAL
jgi:glycosyltransferase involved in cell wall biosynthesis